MNSSRTFTCAIALVVGITASAVGSAAQRTFVASYGNDLDVCTIAAPCRGFTRALTQTDADGEIIVLDSAGYGPVVVDKSVAIIAPAGVYAGVSVFTGGGIVISGSGINVVLRGLAINGQGGNRGIFYTFGSRLRVENCVVSNMSGPGINIGYPGEIVIADTVIRGNGAVGIQIVAPAKVIVERARIEGNAGEGIFLNSNPLGAELAVRDSLIARNGIGLWVLGGTAGSDVTLTGTTLTGNSRAVWANTSTGESVRLFAQHNVITRNISDGFLLQTSFGGTVTATLTDNVISGQIAGVRLFHASNVTVVLDRNTVTENGTGLDQGDGVIQTRSNNTVRLNGTNVSNGPLTAIGGT